MKRARGPRQQVSGKRLSHDLDQTHVKETLIVALDYLQKILKDVCKDGSTQQTASIFVMRIVYILMAEGKGILPHGSDRVYRRVYSLTRLVEGIFRGNALVEDVPIWRSLCKAFELLRNPPLDSTLIPRHSMKLFSKNMVWEEGTAFRGLCCPALDARLREFLGMITTCKTKDETTLLIDFEQFSPRNIGDLYEQLLASQVRTQKEQCAFYTPHWIISYMVEKVLDPLFETYSDRVDRLLSLTFLDPAMGCGYFLVEIVVQMAKRIAAVTCHNEMSLRVRIAEQCIYGVDKNPLAVDLAKCAIMLTCGEKPSDDHLVCGDSVMGCVSSNDASTWEDTDNVFHWMTRFPHLVKKGVPAFDVIVTNPPWLTLTGRGKTKDKRSKNHVDYLSTVHNKALQMYKHLPRGHANLFHLFLERCVRLLDATNGQLGFLVQSSMLSSKCNDGSSYLAKITEGLNITLMLEFPAHALFETVSVGCIVFTAERGPCSPFPFKKFTKDETRALNGGKGSFEATIQAWLHPTGHLIKNVLHPDPIPGAMRSLLNGYLSKDAFSPWGKYGNCCTIAQGSTVPTSKLITREEHLRTGAGKTPLIKNDKVHHFAHVGRKDAEFWITTSSRHSEYNTRLLTKKVINSQNPRRLRGAVVIDTIVGEHAWGFDGVVIHDFTGIPKVVWGLSVRQRTYIFCCLMNSDLLECIIRCFDYTNSITSGRIKALPIPDWSRLQVTTDWSPEWSTLKEMDSHDPVLTILERVDAPLSTQSATGCILLCLVTIGKRMRELTTTNPKTGVITLKTPSCRRVLALMNRFVNHLYGLTESDEAYIRAVYRDLLHVLEKR